MRRLLRGPGDYPGIIEERDPIVKEAAIRDRDTPRKIHVIGAAVLIALVGLGASTVLSLAALLLMTWLDTAGRVLVVIVLSQGLAFMGVALLYARIRRWSLRDLGLRRPLPRHLGWIPGGYLLAIGGAAAGGILALLFGLEPAENQLGVLATDNPELVWLLIALSLLVVGPGEELLFRGAVQGRLREAMGPVGAILSASLIFALAHLLALSGGLAGRATTIAVLLLPSVVFGYLYERTRSVWVPAAVHGLYNATLFATLAL